MKSHTTTVKAALSAEEYKQIKEHVNARGEKIQSWSRRAMLNLYKAEIRTAKKKD